MCRNEASLASRNDRLPPLFGARRSVYLRRPAATHLEKIRMTASYYIRYHGEAVDRDAFLDHYRDVHVPHLLRFPGIRSVVMHHAAASTDPFPVEPGGDLLLAELVFDTLQDLNGALASQARADARTDFASFPEFRGTITHQAMVTEAFQS